MIALLFIPVVALIIYCFIWAEKLYRHANPKLKHNKRASYRRLIPFSIFFAEAMNGVVYNRHNWEVVHQLQPYLLGAALMAMIVVEIVNRRERRRDSNSIDTLTTFQNN